MQHFASVGNPKPEPRVQQLTEEMIAYIRAAGYDVRCREHANGLVECVAVRVGSFMEISSCCIDGDPHDRKHRAVRRLLHQVASDARARLAA